MNTQPNTGTRAIFRWNGLWKKIRGVLGLVTLLLVACLLLAGIIQAQGPEQTYDLSLWTVDGGGGNSGGTGYALSGTAGQPDPGPTLRGGDGPPGRLYCLEGGFWGGGMSGVSWYYIHLPLVLRHY
jgi:hypothetical protein